VKEIIKNMKNLTVKAIHACGEEITDKDKSKEEISIHFLYAIQNCVDGAEVDHMLERIVALSESVTKPKDVEI